MRCTDSFVQDSSEIFPTGVEVRDMGYATANGMARRVISLVKSTLCTDRVNAVEQTGSG